jgi:ribonuclease HI
MPWSRHRLRDADVWAKVDIQGRLVPDAEGRVEVVYKAADGAKVYRAGARNLTPTGDAPIEIAAGEPAADSKKRGEAPLPENAFHVWTDGGCVPNPGPAGIGVVILDGKQRQEISEFLGMGTNNIAELTAIVRGLESLPDRTRPVVVYSDSAYAIGLLTQNWKPKANVELVAHLRKLIREFPEVRFVKVAAHRYRAQRTCRPARGRLFPRGQCARVFRRGFLTCKTVDDGWDSARLARSLHVRRHVGERRELPALCESSRIASRRASFVDRQAQIGLARDLRGMPSRSASAKSIPCSSKLNSSRDAIAASTRLRTISGATSRVVPIAGRRVHGVTAIGSSTIGACPRRHGAVIAGRYGSGGAASCRGLASTAPLGRRMIASAAITAAFAA